PEGQPTGTRNRYAGQGASGSPCRPTPGRPQSWNGRWAGASRPGSQDVVPALTIRTPQRYSSTRNAGASVATRRVSASPGRGLGCSAYPRITAAPGAP